MSVNPDGMRGGMGVAEEYVDLEHQVIRQKVNDLSGDAVVEVKPGDEGSTFDIGERQLDREEIAQLVVYRRSATINWLQTSTGRDSLPIDSFAIVDASVGINGDLFREVTTQQEFDIAGEPDTTLFVDTGGEIGLLDNYQIFAQPKTIHQTDGVNAGGSIAQRADLTINYFDYPTGGPIVDSFDNITCGFGFGADSGGDTDVEVQFELRYDFWWDVAEQGRSTNPFGRPSTR